jgi:sortase A
MRQKLAGIVAGIKNFFITVWRQKTGRVLLVAAGVLLLAAAGLGIGLYLDGIVAEGSAQQLLVQYQQSVNAAAPQNAEQASGDNPAQAETDPDPSMLDGYDVIGILTLEKTAQTLPVISETTDKALKVSVCWFQGVLPGKTGNMVITGHDYASGAHFGQLSKLKAGDRITFADANKTYTYEVYETEIIRPDQPEKLDDYEGDTALTLLTCTSHGNRRLVVRCKPVA